MEIFRATRVLVLWDRYYLASPYKYRQHYPAYLLRLLPEQMQDFRILDRFCRVLIHLQFILIMFQYFLQLHQCKFLLCLIVIMLRWIFT